MGNDEIPMEKEDTTTKTRATSSRAAMDNNGNAGDEREAESASLSPESPPRIQQAHMGLQRDLTKQLDLDLDLTTMTKMQIQRQPSDELEGQAEGQGMGQDRRGVEELDVDLGHHQHMPSSMSGYDTARQTPTPKYGGSFISSSSDSNTFSGATVGNGNAPPSASPSPTAMSAGGGGEESKQARRKSLMMPCSPEDSEVHHSYPHVDMDANNIDADASGQPPLRTRTSSEDHEHVGAGVQNQLSGSAPKFNDTETESVSGSLIYGGSGGGNPSSNNFRKMMMRNNNKRFDSLTSFGNDTFIQLNEDTDGDDGDPDLNDTNVGNSGGQGQQHPFAQPQKTNPNTPNSHKNAHSQGSSTGTPYTSNLTKGGGLRQNHDRGIGGGQDVVEPVLPYHKRKQLTEQQKLQHSFPGGSARGSGSNYDRNMEDVHGQGPIPNSGRKSRRAPELSTITAPAPLRRSPNKQQTQNHSNNSNSSNNSNPHPYHGQYQNQLPPMSGGGGQYGSSSNNNNYAQPPRNRSASDNDYNNNNGHQPPRHPKNLKKSHSHDPGVNGNYYNNDPNSTPNAPPPASSSLARPPALHVRVESSGSVSSLGSLTGGASITRREGRKLAQRLGLELQEYQDHGAGTGTGRDHRQDHDDGGHGHGHGHGHGNSHSHRGNNNSGRGHGHTATGRTRERHDSEGQHDDGNGYISTFLKSIDFTTEGSFTSFGSFRSVEDEKADYRKKGQKFLKKAEKERARQERKNNKGGDRTWIPGIGDKGRTIRSLSPANRSQHEQNRSRLPSIDNDNWEEDDRRKHKKQNSKGSSKGSSFKGSSKGGGMKKKLSGSGSSGGGGGGSNHNHHRPPIRNKRSTSTHGYGTSGGGQGDQQHSTNLGSSGGGSGGRNSSSRSYRSRNRNQPFNPNSRERGGYSDRNRNRSHYQSPSESENSSEEEESCISSDFTSNRFDSDGEDSSVYVDDSEAASTSASEDDYLSYGDDDDDDDEDYHSEEEEGNERTTLLPSGDNTDEYDGRLRRNGQNNLPPHKSKDKSRYRDGNNRRLDRDSSRQQGDKRYHRDQGPTRYDSRNKSRSRKDVSGGGYRDRDSRDLEYGGYDDARARDYGRGGYDPDIRQLLHEERLAMEKQMRKAMMEEWQENQLHNRFRRWVGSGVKSVTTKVGIFCTNAEAFISNLPLTIGAVALAVVTMGVVWFKFSEEMMDSCMPVHFHSDQCNFPEFPGCFYCDTSVRWYRIAYGFHNTCTAIALVISLLFLLKIVIARNVVIDEMNSPTTSSPAGLICMTLVCVCAGRGMAGQIMVSIAAAAHFCLALWFIYMASAYNILPDPSWYPNTVGIGISAVKTWLYYPMLGHFLMLTSMTLFSIFYPISLFRVAVNKKLSAPVSWIQMSAPAVSLYALTIMAQPSFEEEHPDITDFQRVHRMLYLPAMHFFFVCTILGALSSVQSLIVRWDTFSKKPFSPAHAAFCFPTLAHANAVQAYRGAIDSFSDIQPGSPLKIALFCYWFFVLIVGTLSTFIITAKFFYMLPSWTRVDIEDEIEPPQPHETLISEVILAGETYRQNFVSPAVLQANETGALIQIRERGKSKYVRTRRVTALGFEPIMNIMELQNEREKLLEWVEKNPPRQRKRTLSVPGITIPGSDFGSNNVGVYGAMSRNAPSSEQRRRRAQTSDGNYAFTGRYPV